MAQQVAAPDTVSEFFLIPKRVARRVPALATAAKWLEGKLLLSVLWLIDRLSIESASKLGATLFGIMGARSSKANKARQNLAIAFPEYTEEEIETTVRGIFSSLGTATAELLKSQQIWEERQQRLEFHISPTVLSWMDAGKPAIFVSAHIGAWQICPLLSLHMGFTLSTIYAKESNPSLQQALFDLRQSFGANLIASSDGVRPLLRELKAGNSLGMAIDTRIDSGELLPFFGVDALTNVTPAGLAVIAGAALVPIRCLRLRPGYYRMEVGDPIDNPCPEATNREQATAMSALINEHFEQWIRETPEQWICLKRRWPKPGKL